MVRRFASASLAAIALILVASCREIPIAPETLAARHSPARFDPPAPPAPGVVAMRTLVQGGSLRVHAVLHPVAPGAPAFYSADQPGGWFVQLFLDTDQQPTGYGLGYEFVVRGGELDPDQTCTIRHTEGGGGPGGWGEEVGRARIDVHAQSLEITIPLAAIADDGQVNYTIESYLTVPCGECEGGVTAIWTGAMSGSTQQRAIARRVPLRPGRVRADQFFPGL